MKRKQLLIAPRRININNIIKKKNSFLDGRQKNKMEKNRVYSNIIEVFVTIGITVIFFSSVPGLSIPMLANVSVDHCTSEKPIQIMSKIIHILFINQKIKIFFFF